MVRGRSATAVPGEHIVVVGGGPAGMCAALLLARGGRRVTLLDKNPVPAPADFAEIDRWERPGIPQTWHSHAFLARCRAVLGEVAPDVLDALLAAGVREIRLADGAPGAQPGEMPPENDSATPPETTPPETSAGMPAEPPAETAPATPGTPSPRAAATDVPAGGELVVLGARRVVVDWVLQRAVAAEPGVDFRPGARVTGLLTERVGRAAGPAAVTRVRGVELADGSTLGADLVVDACGRQSPVAGWLGRVGAERPAELTMPCGITYYSRFYARRDGAAPLPTPLNRGHTVGASFDRYSCLVFPADNDTFSVTFGVLPEDTAIRVLRHDDAFDAAVRSIPVIAPWLAEPGVRPITHVTAMANMRNRVRPWVDGGRVTVVGLLPVGDAALISNPAHTRGTTLAVLSAARLAETVQASADPVERALRLDAFLRAELLPWFYDSCAQDDARLSRWRAGSGQAGTRQVGAETPAPDRGGGTRSRGGGPSGPGGVAGEAGEAGRPATRPGTAGGAATSASSSSAAVPTATAAVRGTARVTESADTTDTADIVGVVDIDVVAAGRTLVSNGEAFTAAGRDPHVWLTFTRLQNLLGMPRDVLDDPVFAGRVHAVLSSGWRLPPQPAPSRDELIDIATTATEAATGAATEGATAASAAEARGHRRAPTH